jgi:hypothetical protein
MAMAASFVLAIGTSVGSYRTATERAARAWYATPLYVSAQGSAAYLFDQPLPESLAPSLEKVPGVRAAYPMRFGLVNRQNHQLVIYGQPGHLRAPAGQRARARPDRRFEAHRAPQPPVDRRRAEHSDVVWERQDPHRGIFRRHRLV